MTPLPPEHDPERVIQPPAVPLPPDVNDLPPGYLKRARRLLASQPRLADPSSAEETIYPPAETQFPENIRDLTRALNVLEEQKLLTQALDELQPMVLPWAWSVFTAIYLKRQPYAEVAKEQDMSLTRIIQTNSKLLERLKILLRGILDNRRASSGGDNA